jgi:hypothetical protein
MSYPHNLMIQRNQTKDVIKGALFLGALVLMVSAFFIFSGPSEYGDDTVVIVCPGSASNPQCQVAHN